MFSRRDVLTASGAGIGIGIATGTSTAFALDKKQNRDSVTARFHRLYYDSGVWQSSTHWLGVQVWKVPLDLWAMQEILHETKPDVLVETGTYRGGSALYFATMMDLLGTGRVYTVDIEDHAKPQHPRIHFRKDSSISDETLMWLRSEIRPGERVMVTLDSLHTRTHVLAELERYAPLVSSGCYLIVEDTCVNGHPIYVDLDRDGTREGPWEAVEEWLPKHEEFERDRTREKFYMTFNPGGWLRRR